jgi:phage terminase large subunit
VEQSAKHSSYLVRKHRRDSRLQGGARTWIKPTVLDTFKKVFKSVDEWKDEAFNKSELTYQHYGSSYEFYGLDDSQKLHGIETDFFWLNEAIETSKDDFDQLEQRCKGKWILDYNPSTDEHWIYDNVLKRDDVVLIHSTMLDNTFLDQHIRDKINSYQPTPENHSNRNGRRIQVEGLWARRTLKKGRRDLRELDRM